MVEAVRAGSVGGPEPPVRDDTRPSVPFIVNGAVPASVQNVRVSNFCAIGLNSVLTLQAVDEVEERDRRARKQGSVLLAALAKLQQTMLSGLDPSLAIRALDELAAECPEADDPALGAILKAIVLRSRVEIARRRVREAAGRPGQG